MASENHPSQCRLSTRISLRWVPEPAFENTDTIVMSVAGWYVDLRVDKESGGIDWAIAGRRVVDDKDSSRVAFTHELDCRNSFDAVDCGTFSSLPNGDDLEEGEMPRADLPGCPVAQYEEVWRELKFRDGPEGHKGVSWVLESKEQPLDEGEEVEVERTFIGRIWGTYLALRQLQVHSRPKGSATTIVKEGKDVSARREEWNASGWRVKHSLGADALPSMNDIEDGSWKLGQTVTVAEKEYTVRAFESLRYVTSSIYRLFYMLTARCSERSGIWPCQRSCPQWPGWPPSWGAPRSKGGRSSGQPTRASRGSRWGLRSGNLPA
ncbi:hypothetical protein BO94DRAFT_467768 [Aspergillus sclerotioniger CBS 115572]|uniref:Protein HRI1 n=1 Tax=Aspergillus sclerotioniger CBS 115572 TaxID=1450535 RepID=A0A317WHW0_9EURO|nr:hypothetical protein BO94DRAFT_467768 [Aspergillus sclerotioniger CBS 115572]PWY85869.1 hypothetical protein BO94DRAFT_467768 [Aspergillus sclerotioniger CBS 115572]